jgi:hypothetical protein
VSGDFVSDALERLQPVEPRREFADALFERFSTELLTDSGAAPVDLIAAEDSERLFGRSRRPRRRRWIATVAVAAAVAIVGVIVVAALARGGDRRVQVSAPKPPTREQFIAAAGPICTSDDAALASLYARSANDVAALQRGQNALLHDVVTRMSRIPLPPADAARLRPALDDFAVGEQLGREGLGAAPAIRRATQTLFDYGVTACNPDLVPAYPTTPKT